jgi:hypothetical protein
MRKHYLRVHIAFVCACVSVRSSSRVLVRVVQANVTHDGALCRCATHVMLLTTVVLDTTQAYSILHYSCYDLVYTAAAIHGAN